MNYNNYHPLLMGIILKRSTGISVSDMGYEEDGSVWVYYLDQKIGITDKFDDNVCYVQISNEKNLVSDNKVSRCMGLQS